MAGETPRDRRQEHEAGDYFTWALLVPLALIGVFMASRAHDDEIYVFGLSLLGFCAFFALGEINYHYKAQENAKALQNSAAMEVVRG